MYIESMNRPVLALDDAHPAKRFLCAFIECRTNCVGRELGQDGEIPIDQEWTSASDGKVWTFSSFAYRFLAFDIELDGFLQSVPSLTASETGGARQLPWFRSLMNECAQAARQSENSEIIELTVQVLEMLNLWEKYLGFRRDMIANVRRTLAQGRDPGYLRGQADIAGEGRSDITAQPDHLDDPELEAALQRAIRKTKKQSRG